MAALFAPLAFWGVDALAGPIANRNLPSACTGPAKKCGCNTEEISVKCIKVNIDLGETTPWTGSLECALKIFADNDSPLIFTADSLYAVLGGYTFKKLGLRNLSDGVTPAEVIFSHDNGEPIHFVFADGESVARPDPGIHVKMDERLMMVDAEGWAATHDPVYYDLYVGDGTRRRFLATDIAGTLGSLVSITDARGVTVTPADMGVDVVYDANGVRQYMTPSRLADVARTADSTGYDVRVYALQVPPVKDAATGLYPVPNAIPVKQVSIRRENGGKRAVVSVVRGGGEPRCYVFDYVMGDWSLTRPSGVEERKERVIDDERAAQVLENTFSAAGVRLARSEYNYKWESWGFAMTNRVEGFGGVTDTTTWTYYTSGNGKGQVKTEKRQSGMLTQYAYDSLDRVTSESRSGPDMMTEVTTYDYMPVDPSDPVLPVDTRPRTVVRKLNNIECERTYYVYSPLTNIVERVGTQGAPYGGTNVLRTVTAFYPVAANDARSGFVASIRHEDGKLDLYDYELSSNTWIRTVTHLHEQSPAPVSGKTTRDITITNARGETSETRTEAFIDGIWYTIARNQMTYNSEGKRTSVENLAGQVTTTAWDCCHKVSEVQPDGSTTTWDYDADGRMIAASRLIPLDMTNVTWLTTCYEYDDLGRQTATWQTNFAAQVGLPATRTRYDALSRVIARVDQLGNTTTTTRSPDGRTVSVQNPNTSTSITTRSADGDMLSITGSAVTPEFHAYGILSDGTRWSRIVQGETSSSPSFTKRYENIVGQTIREERSGFQGAVLATTHVYDSYGRLASTVADYEPTIDYAYDAFGNRIATTRLVGASVPARPSEWRKTEMLSAFALADSIVWLTQTNIVSCSDSVIAPLVTSSARQLTGLTAALPARSRSFDVRGNVTENETVVDLAIVTSRQTVPYATNKPLALSRYGVSLMEVSVSAVTNTVAYDSLGRQIATTDGRGNTRHVEYNSFGQRSASIDALGNRTSYAYDQFGNLASVADPLGNATVYEYDLRGHKTYEGGATYPVRYTYDIFGNKTTMTTYRDESVGRGDPTALQGDVTTWLYDIASGSMTNKVYADGKGPTYSYTPDGKLSQRIWARGIVTDYSYDAWGSLTNTVYSDGTPTISLSYDALGRQIEAHDAAGVTTFAYDSFGSLTNETVIGVAGTNTIIRHWDNYGRSQGYSLVGLAAPCQPQRQSTLAYDPATGRLATMLAAGSEAPFTWNYLAESDLKSSLAYPNGLTVAWTCNANNQFLQVHNASPTNVISQYDYTYDAAGRRIEVSKSGFAFTQDDTIAYGYNNRSELTNAVAAVDSDYRYDYDFDDIGNRETSSERGTNSVYTANNLNQYTLVGRVVPNAPQEEFIPQFDNDGNQTLVKTATGVWSVTYNGENRPVLWTLINSSTPNSSTPTLISMSYDRMGRRMTKNDQRFVYNGYLQIANFEHQTSNLKLQTFIWDPTEKIATRPLVWNFSTLQPFNFSTSYYTHDGNKNVSEVVAENGNIAAHYEYAPFGAVSTQCGAAAESNPWRFSSEYAEDETSTIYYNYRHYEPVIGKWLSRDPIEEDGGIINIYSYLDNTFGLYSDWIGQFPILPIFQAAFTSALKDAAKSFIISALTSWYDIALDNGKLVYDAMMSCVNGDFDFHPIKLYRPRDTSSLVKGFREALKDGFSSFITEALTGSLSEIIRGHASDFLKADPKSAYYEYFKKIEKFMKKDGVEELTDEMVKAISELAIIKVTDLSSLINSIDIVSDDEQMVKWTVKDKCRMCATVEESYTVTMTIMGEKQDSFVVPGPKTERCFDYDEIKSRGPVGREIISGCSLCPCKKK
jgi:RHS repeat-associated protein